MAAPQETVPTGQMSGAVPTIEEIVALLMQGISPEDLVEMGVPPEMIMEAVALLEQQMAAQQQAVPPEAQGGLAAQSLSQPAGAQY